MTSDEQLARWVEGESVHNDELEECCPDFSCCEPRLLADKAERQAFKDANDDDRHAMLFGFLGAGMALASDGDVYVAGDPASHVREQ